MLLLLKLTEEGYVPVLFSREDDPLDEERDLELLTSLTVAVLGFASILSHDTVELSTDTGQKLFVVTSQSGYCLAIWSDSEINRNLARETLRKLEELHKSSKLTPLHMCVAESLLRSNLPPDVLDFVGRAIDFAESEFKYALDLSVNFTELPDDVKKRMIAILEKLPMKFEELLHYVSDRDVLMGILELIKLGILIVR
ncbi:MAG: hypothetical protein DRJ40_01120 [Thermoprotei archaeon]|nr:MAG: hypothetical protein DRJ40_01120 [Thermoprotei archaeon]